MVLNGSEDQSIESKWCEQESLVNLLYSYTSRLMDSDIKTDDKDGEINTFGEFQIKLATGSATAND